MASQSDFNPAHIARRDFLGVASMSMVALEIAMESQKARAADVSSLPRTALAAGVSSFTEVKQITAGDLNVGYIDMGQADGEPVILLHGWPYDIHSFREVAPILVEHRARVIIPYLRGFGSTLLNSREAIRNAQQAAIAVDIVSLMDALHISKATLAGFDWGARTANIIAALWPERCKAMVSVSGYLIGSQAAGRQPLPPEAELQWWYQFYFATDRGQDGYRKNTADFAKLIWRQASPKWAFDEATFQRSAQAFQNADHADIVISNYRWRLGLIPGDSRFDSLEKRLSLAPLIEVPTITMEGDANGAPHLDPPSYAKMFSGRYSHRNIKGGIGHNLPQEAPKEFAEAILDILKG